jgi:hypothetical protein
LKQKKNSYPNNLATHQERKFDTDVLADHGLEKDATEFEKGQPEGSYIGNDQNPDDREANIMGYQLNLILRESPPEPPFVNQKKRIIPQSEPEKIADRVYGLVPSHDQ